MQKEHATPLQWDNKYLCHWAVFEKLGDGGAEVYCSDCDSTFHLDPDEVKMLLENTRNLHLAQVVTWVQHGK